MTSSSGSGDRILAIIDLFTEERPEWLPDEMMQALGYSRPTLYRYLKSLKNAGFLSSLPNQGFTLGPKVTELDFLMQRADLVVAKGQPALKDLARQFVCSAFITRWYNDKILCVASEVSTATPLSSYQRGRPMPLSRGAISRVIVANLTKNQRLNFISRHLEEARLAGWGSSFEEINNGLLKERRSGVAVAYGQVTAGVVGIAAPILTGKDAPIAALCVTVEQSLITDDLLGHIKISVAQHARTISISLECDRPALSLEQQSSAQKRTAYEKD
ncbi:MAG: helix-turn-helix domain-containing protein [Paracoccaceae bacterium]|jgi:DNA-binding IclR family transcriptional regulator|nr:helix-turn-helix domain-containing protein [Paracoccaceae bacterium]